MSKAEATGLDAGRAKRQARREFEAWADSYDRSLLNRFLFRPSDLVFMEEVARWYAQRNGAFSVLDVGCGTGTFVGLLAASPWPVRAVGLDYTPAMCAAASHKAAQAGA